MKIELEPIAYIENIRTKIKRLIDNGEIVEEGNHSELINKRGRYYRLYTNQYVDEHEINMLHENQ